MNKTRVFNLLLFFSIVYISNIVIYYMKDHDRLIRVYTIEYNIENEMIQKYTKPYTLEEWLNNKVPGRNVSFFKTINIFNPAFQLGYCLFSKRYLISFFIGGLIVFGYSVFLSKNKEKLIAAD